MPQWIAFLASLSALDWAVAPLLGWPLGISILQTIAFLGLALSMWRARGTLESASRSFQRWRSGGIVVCLALSVIGLGQKFVVLFEGVGLSPETVSTYRTLTIYFGLLCSAGIGFLHSSVDGVLQRLVRRPMQIAVLSFAIASVLGAFLLSLPQATRHPVSFLDNLFTAVSAVCVTGLTVNVIGQDYTLLGQGVILALFQIGGLGIMMVSTTILMLFGEKLGVQAQIALAETLDVRSLGRLKKQLIRVIVVAIGIELLGAIVLYASFSAAGEVNLIGGDHALLSENTGRIWSAVFHSVSAFCNAGFSIFSTGLQPFAENGWVSLTIMLLIVAGGLGFPVLVTFGSYLRSLLKNQRPYKLSLHARVCVMMTVVLVGIGTIGFLSLETSGVMSPLAWSDRALIALFQSVTARTAGFSTLDFGNMAPATLTFTCFLMFIGACPASTGGGIKTTTVAVLFSAFRAEFLRRPQQKLFDRGIDDAMVRRAISVLFTSICLQAALVFLLQWCEPKQDPLDLVFEAFSAFATVGLSTGITEELGSTAKCLLIAGMFVGRLGPLTIVVALATRSKAPAYRLADESVLVG